MEEIRNVFHFIFLINTQGFKSFAARDEVCFSNWTKTDDPFTAFTGKRYLNSVENSVYVESLQAPVFEQLDNLIHLINHYPANKYEGNQLF